MILKKALKTVVFHGLFPFVYKWHARRPVHDKSVLFVEIRYAELTTNFRLLWDEFCKNNNMSVDIVFLGNSVFSYGKYLKSCFQMLKKLARAQIVLVDESSNVLAALPIRPETKMVQVWHACGAFKRFGHGIIGGLDEKYYNDYMFTTVSSPYVIDIYADSMKQAKEKVLPIGVSRTDVFFSKDYVDQCNQFVRNQYGIDSQKKIMLYAPTFRGNVQCAISPRLLEISKLYSALRDEYVILYKGHPSVKTDILLDDAYKNFFIDVSDDSIEPLMCAADICVTDYSSLIFEYALLERPMFFYAYDYKEYVTERGFYFDYEELVPGPICYTEEELIWQINRTSKADIIKDVIAFKKKFMSGCDGKSTQRIVETILLDRDNSGII